MTVSRYPLKGARAVKDQLPGVGVVPKHEPRKRSATISEAKLPDVE